MSSHRHRVLVVDDHQLLREGVRSLLESEGYEEILEACDGRDALTKAAEARPDLVIMDLTMPNMNGIDATRQMLAAVPGIKVVAISARTDATTVREVLAAGALAFVPKDAAFEELTAAIHAADQGQSYVSPRVTSGLLDTFVRDTGEKPIGRARALTDREREVLQLVAEGLAMKQIAYRLELSVKTIETHRRQIMDKLGLHSVAELTKYAVRHGMTPA